MDVGDEVPDFTATLDSGETTSLSALLEDGPVVLFFYPKAFTGGCTAEALPRPRQRVRRGGGAAARCLA